MFTLLAVAAPAQLDADFSATPVTGVNPLQVAFTDTSSGGTITAWSWDFGDGATSTLQNPSHIYQAGTTTQFTVSLQAFIGQQSDTVVKRDVITVSPAPLVVDFSASATLGVNPMTVTFTDTSSGATVTGWIWDFGDGAGSTLQNPTNQYDTPGDYTVSLTVAVGPQNGVLVKPDYITVAPAPVVVDFSATPTQGVNPLQVSFGDLTTGAVIDAWSWDFGDGNGSTQQNPAHTYALPGNHDVQLTTWVGQQVNSVTKPGFVSIAHAPLAAPLFHARTYLTGQNPLRGATADLDNDGATDLVTVDLDADSLSILLGRGEGGF